MSRDEVRLPPQDVQAEQSVLACQMLDERTCDAVRGIISHRDFYLDVHATIQRAITLVHDAGGNVDALTVAEQLNRLGQFEEIGGTPYMNEIMEAVPHAAHAAEYARIVLDRSRRRTQVRVAAQLTARAYDLTVPTAEATAHAVEAVTELDSKQSGALTVLSEAVDALLSSFEAGHRQTEWIGIPPVDEMTGGLAPGEMVVVGARPGHGKSLFALQTLDCAASQGWPGLIISEEMAAVSLATRALSSLTAIPSGEWLQQTDRLRFDAREHFRGRAPVYIAEKCATATGAERAIAAAVRQHGVRIVAVDYAQLLRGTGDTEQERIADVSQRMKAAAMRHDVIVVLLAQLNRAIESRDDPTPTLADLRGSGSLEQDADIVLFPMWPMKFDATYSDPREYRVYQAKNRSRGVSTAVVTLEVNAERQRLQWASPVAAAEEWR